jgi:hypothetical protein
MVWESRIKLVALSDGTNTYKIRMGLGNTTGAGDNVNGVYFEYDSTVSANWRLKSATNSTRTTVTSTLPVVAGKWRVLKIEINYDGNIARFYCDGVLLDTITANIPTATYPFSLNSKIEKTVGTSASLALIDYVFFKKCITIDRGEND